MDESHTESSIPLSDSHASSVQPILHKSSVMVGGFEPGSDLRDDTSQHGSIHHAESQEFEDSIEHSDGVEGRSEQEYEQEYRHQDYGNEMEPRQHQNCSSSFRSPEIDQPGSLMHSSSPKHYYKQHQSHHEHYEETDLPGFDTSQMPVANNTVLEEEEMHRKLKDYESSFLREPSVLEVQQIEQEHEDQHHGNDWESSSQVRASEHDLDAPVQSAEHEAQHQHQSSDLSHHSPVLHNARFFTTGGYQTPSHEHQEEHDRTHAQPQTIFHTTHGGETPQGPDTSALERMSSSPTAARTVSRVQSLASIGGYETAAEDDMPESPIWRRAGSAQEYSFEDAEETPRKSDRTGPLKNDLLTSSFDADSTGGHSVPFRADNDNLTRNTAMSSVYDPNPANVDTRRQRPEYLTKRSSNARLSYDSTISSASDATMGADYGLMTGGTMSGSTSLRCRPNMPMTLSRSTSLGSMASGMSGTITDDEEGGMAMSTSRRTISGLPSIQVPELSTLEEESPTLQRIGLISMNDSATTVTPKASRADFDMPSDSTITKHVRDIEVPGTIARQFRAEHQQQNGLGATFNISPAKSTSVATMTPGPNRRTGAGAGGLTLKEHRSKVDQLAKENFDLKMKCHFLDEALRKRSDEGIQEIIRENVQLKTERLRLEKDNFGMKRELKDLQRKLQELEGKEKKDDDQGYASDEEREPTMEEEVVYLRQRVEISEEEVERLRQENSRSEIEKKRLADVVRNMAFDNGGSRVGPSEVGSREERDMWKDMLEQETIRADQLKNENDRLAKENDRFKMGSARPRSTLRVVGGNVVPVGSSPNGSEVGKPGTPTMTERDVAELARLRHEVGELQKTNSAQINSLASRNKEKELLYQDIEILKLKLKHGSTTGDSILDRSASRARSNSRTSDRTRFTRVSDGERESWEARINELRDELSHIKLETQKTQNERDQAVADFEAIDAQAQADADQFNEELNVLTAERDNAVRDADEQDAAFQQLKTEAQDEIDGLGNELDAKSEECERLMQELQLRTHNLSALQAEMRSATEAVLRLEQDAQSHADRYASVKQELDDRHREFTGSAGREREARDKVEHLTVQMESSRNEVAFLREEQDADKIKIADLESLLKKTHLNLDAERDRAKDLDRRLNDERHQREAVANHEKAEVQRMLNDLNREATTAKGDLRSTRKALSAREVEVNSFRERLAQLEDGLRQSLRMLEGTSHTHLISTTSKMSKDLSTTLQDLDHTRRTLSEHKSLLQDRDILLENTALEQRRLDELLERERASRRQDAHSFEQSLKGHEQASRMASASNNRLAELESARQKHRAQLTDFETRYKEQLSERNQTLLSIWRKLSTLCGPDWTHNHSLINGNLPSQEVIGNILFWPGFSRNLLMAVRQVEGVLGGFRDKIRTVERDLNRNYAGLQKEFEAQNKKLERIEDGWEKVKVREREVEAGLAPGSSHGMKTLKLEMKKLRNENKLLKAEPNLYQQQHHQHAAHAQAHDNAAVPDRTTSTRLQK
ncbi:hypothetical protein LTR66_011712, partial [Elasticomyces elasticus]